MPHPIRQLRAFAPRTLAANSRLLFLFLFSLCLAVPARAATTLTVTDEVGFTTAFAAADTGTIILGGNIKLGASVTRNTSPSAPLFLDGASHALDLDDNYISTTQEISGITGLTIRNGVNTSGSGGALEIGTFSGDITNSLFEDNAATASTGSAYGGAVYVQNTFNSDIGAGTVFSRNKASGQTEALGGAVYAGSFTGDITGARFESNAASSTATNSFALGGAVYADSLTGDITGARFENNAVSTTVANSIAYGGAVYVRNAFDGDIGAGTVFSGNKASGQTEALGGAVRAGSFFGSITGARFENNAIIASEAGSGAIGGAIFVNDAFTGDIGAGTVFSGNKATGQDVASGGALRAYSFTGSITGARFENNTTTASAAGSLTHGGAVYVIFTFDSDIGAGTVFSGNEVSGQNTARGGAIYAASFTGSITGARFENNTATASAAGSSAAGGALFAFGGLDSDIGAGTVFSGNKATGQDQAYGGAVRAFFSTRSITGARFENNTATASAAGSFAHGGAVYLGGHFNNDIGAGTVFSGNKATGQDAATGGAMRTGSFTGAITGARFENNTATASAAVSDAAGGALFVNDAFTGSIAGTVFSGNKAQGQNEATGGAVRVSSYTGSITGTRFENNTAAGAAKSFGGAIAITSLNAVDTALILDATGGAVLFRGNKAGGLANAIHFGRDDASDAAANSSLTVLTAPGRDVALYDPISVDLNNSKTFAMIVSGAGDFIWGGRNDLAANGGASVRFVSDANTLLQSDFQLTNLGDRFTHGVFNGTGNTGTLTVSFVPGSRFALDLTTRPTGDALPFFFRGDPALTGVFTLDGAMTIDEVNAMTFDEVDNRWLLADAADVAGITADTFRVSSGSSLFSASVMEENGKYYLTFDNRGLMNNTQNSPNANTSGAYAADQFSGIWDAYLASDAGKAASYLERRTLFLNLAAKPQTYLGEAAFTLTAASMTMQESTTLGAWRMESVSRAATEQAAARSTAALASPILGGGGRYALRFWGGYTGGKSRQSADAGYYGSKSRFNGGVVGVSYDFNSCVTAGGWFSHASGISRADALNSKGKTKADSAGLFLSLRPSSRWTIDLDASYGRYQNDLRRDNLSGTYSADYDQHVFSAGGKLAYHIDAAGFRISPYAGLRYQHLRQDSFRERGGLFAFRFGSTDADSFASRLGVEASREFDLGCGRSLMPSLRAGWRHEFADRRYTASGGFAAVPQTYRLYSAKLGRDALEAGLGLRAVLVRTERFRLDAEVSYDLDVRENYVGQNWYAGMGLSF